MDRQSVIDRLLSLRPALEALGIAHVSLFGSAARGTAGPGSDIDLAVRLDPAAGFDLFRFAALGEQVGRLLGSKVDLVVEPARSSRVQAEIERDRLLVY